ncbi:MAG: Com family DNA-binding transcriptional regulator [Alphaproteobacteria bacterium]|nr:Com family DNA-binding transcriptional regulator [Alphaproteobacteria bacterium]
MESIRCLKCNKLLFKANSAEVEIKCPRCGTLNTITVKNRNNQESQEPPFNKEKLYEKHN